MMMEITYFIWRCGSFCAFTFFVWRTHYQRFFYSGQINHCLPASPFN